MISPKLTEEFVRNLQMNIGSESASVIIDQENQLEELRQYLGVRRVKDIYGGFKLSSL